ncbi:MAG: winged helix DNA-binding protein [Marinicellaceae bacterium]
MTKEQTNKNAFLGKAATELTHVSSKQVLEIYKQRKILISVEVSSTLLFLFYNSHSSLADVATDLNLPHQLIAKRVNKLLNLKLLKKQQDSKDKRRTELKLTKQGIFQAKLLQQCMNDMSVVYQELYQEIGCDLPKYLNDAINALNKKTILERFESNFGTGEEYEYPKKSD